MNKLHNEAGGLPLPLDHERFFSKTKDPPTNPTPNDQILGSSNSNALPRGRGCIYAMSRLTVTHDQFGIEKTFSAEGIVQFYERLGDPESQAPSHRRPRLSMSIGGGTMPSIVPSTSTWLQDPPRMGSSAAKLGMAQTETGRKNSWGKDTAVWVWDCLGTLGWLSLASELSLFFEPMIRCSALGARMSAQGQGALEYTKQKARAHAKDHQANLDHSIASDNRDEMMMMDGSMDG